MPCNPDFPPDLMGTILTNGLNLIWALVMKWGNCAMLLYVVRAENPRVDMWRAQDRLMIDWVRPNKADRYVKLENQWLPVGICFSLRPWAVVIRPKWSLLHSNKNLMNSLLHLGVSLFLLYWQWGLSCSHANHPIKTWQFLPTSLYMFVVCVA